MPITRVAASIIAFRLVGQTFHAKKKARNLCPSSQLSLWYTPPVRSSADGSNAPINSDVDFRLLELYSNLRTHSTLVVVVPLQEKFQSRVTTVCGKLGVATSSDSFGKNIRGLEDTFASLLATRFRYACDPFRNYNAVPPETDGLPTKRYSRGMRSSESQLPMAYELALRVFHCQNDLKGLNCHSSHFKERIHRFKRIGQSCQCFRTARNQFGPQPKRDFVGIVGAAGFEDQGSRIIRSEYEFGSGELQNRLIE